LPPGFRFKLVVPPVAIVFVPVVEVKLIPELAPERVRADALAFDEVITPEAVIAAALTVPVNVGEAENTRFPVPVVPVTDERRLAAVIVDTRFFEASVATSLDAVRFEPVMFPETVSDPAVATPRFELVENRFVDEAVVAKKFVVVAEVPVAVVKVKDWRVEEPLATMFCAVRVPVRVCVPPFAVVKNRFVVEPVVVKKLVVVAFVPVALANRMFEKLRLEPVRFVAKKLVEVADVVVPLTAVKF
jgi:hypothetical protein